MTRLWILGASDPEMQAIEALLAECGETVAYATAAGARVHPGNMYRADAIRDADGAEITWSPGCAPECYLVECDAPSTRAPIGNGWARQFDHHRPGDPGYGRPPAEFLPASSAGQVVTELARLGVLPRWRGTHLGDGRAHDGVSVGDWTAATLPGSYATLVPREIVLAAAADHCLGAAYRGECPGVDPDRLMRWRAESRAAYQGRPVAEVLADVASAQEALREAPLLTLQGQDHCGPTGLCGCGPDSYGSDSPIASTYYGTGDCYCDCDGCSRPSVTVRDMRRPDPIAELPEAATRLGVGYMSGPLNQPDGRRKFTCSGSAEQVSAWMRWAPEHGLTDIYGDPARGFAGGYEVAAGEEMRP